MNLVRPQTRTTAPLSYWEPLVRRACTTNFKPVPEWGGVWCSGSGVRAHGVGSKRWPAPSSTNAKLAPWYGVVMLLLGLEGRSST